MPLLSISTTFPADWLAFLADKSEWVILHAMYGWKRSFWTSVTVENRAATVLFKVNSVLIQTTVHVFASFCSLGRVDLSFFSLVKCYAALIGQVDGRMRPLLHHLASQEKFKMIIYHHTVHLYCLCNISANGILYVLFLSDSGKVLQ